MKLQVGLVANSWQWEQILRMEGVPFATLDLSQHDISSSCSLLVVNRNLMENEQSSVEEYLTRGGAVLGYAEHMLGVCGTTARPERVDYLVADGDAIFPDIHMLDLGIRGWIPVEANTLRTQTNSFGVSAGPLGKGFAVVLPFDPATICHDVRVANKNFYFRRDRLPSERVSLVSRGEIRHLLHRSFEYLHHVRHLPYLHAWWYPEGTRNLLAFRIDSDGSAQSDVDELYHLARDHGVSMSWYLDVKSHESWLSHFTTFVNQEIGIHCYDHQTYDTFDENLKNISRAVRDVEGVGVRPVGFTAPYGMWNPELARVINEVGFEYSSEFAFAYDTFPLYPAQRERRYHTLQVPIHPICIGSMRKVGYTEKEMTEYFRTVVDRKLARNEPLFFYHHPSHRHNEVVADLFDYVFEKGIRSIVFAGYARWWKRRVARSFSMELNDDVVTMETPPDNDVWVRIARPGGEEAIVPFAPRLDFKSLPWVYSAPPVRPPEDIRRIREFDPRGMVADLFTTLTRRFK